MNEKPIIDIINSAEDLEYNKIKKLSTKIILKKFEKETTEQYKQEREKYTTEKGALSLGRSYANIIKCRKFELNIKYTEELENIEELKNLIKYVFRVNYSYEDIFKIYI